MYSCSPKMLLILPQSLCTVPMVRILGVYFMGLQNASVENVEYKKMEGDGNYIIRVVGIVCKCPTC